MTSRQRVLRVLWVLVFLLLTGLPSPPPVQARLFGRRGLLAQIAKAAIRASPLRGVARPLEQRQDAYRDANRWLSLNLAARQQRESELRRLYRAHEIDLRTYIKYQTTNLRRQEQYIELKDRMTKVAYDRFNRAFGRELGQLAMAHFMPRLARSAHLQRRVAEGKEALERTRKLLEDGALRIDQLAGAAYPEFLKEGRAKLAEGLDRLQRAGISGGPIDPLLARLRELERGLARLEVEVPAMVTPDQVQALQEQARTAAAALTSVQQDMDKGLKRLADRNTIYFPVRGVERNVQVAAKVGEYAGDQSIVERALADAETRRAMGPVIDAALQAIGVERSDPLYNKIRQRALRLFDPAQLDDLSADDVNAFCRTAREQIEREAAQQPIYGRAVLVGDMGNLTPRADYGKLGDVQWQWFQLDIPPNRIEDVIGCTDVYPMPEITAIDLRLEIDLDNREMSGYWSGQAVGACGTRQLGSASGSFEAQVLEATVGVEEDGKGFYWDGTVWVNVAVAGQVLCGYDKQGQKSGGFEASFRGQWRAGKGEIVVAGWDKQSNLRHHLMVVDPPFDI